jgi:hypothetical protein
MKVLIANHQQVAELLPMNECIDVDGVLAPCRLLQ